MESNELDNKIINHVRNKIVVSNLEREERMRLDRKKQIISLCTVAIVALSGGFLTVNAATDGKLAQEIKNKYEEIIQVKIDESKYEITQMQNAVDEISGDEYVTYKINSKDGSEEIETVINKNNLDKENMKVTEEIKEDGTDSITFDYR